MSRAIIIGGSITGMLAARVLSDHFDTVTIVDRDTIPDAPEFRKGVPQAHHIHLLLARGQTIMEELFPGLSVDLSAVGAPTIRWGLDTLFIAASGQMPRTDGEISTNLVTRISLEHIVRQHLHRISNIEWQTETDVLGLLCSEERVMGIQTQHRRSHETAILNAELVVDASGRSSKTPQWLDALGYDAPEETFVDAHLGYATRWYQLPDGFTSDWQSLAIRDDPHNANYRQGGAFRVEGNQFVLTLQGSNGDYPPTDEVGFMEFARSLIAPHFYEMMQVAEPISPIYGYRRTQNSFRHYEKLRFRPENLIVMGDAACAFNPVYGQGMTVAAMQAQELRTLIEQYDVTDLAGFAAVFQKRLATIMQPIWVMATASDLRYPDTEGNRSVIVRMTQIYTDWLFDVMPHDAVIGKEFMQVMNLNKMGTALMKPAIIGRVLWHKFLRPKAPTPIGKLSYDVPQQAESFLPNVVSQ